MKARMLSLIGYLCSCYVLHETHTYNEIKLRSQLSENIPSLHFTRVVFVSLWTDDNVLLSQNTLLLFLLLLYNNPSQFGQLTHLPQASNVPLWQTAPHKSEAQGKNIVQYNLLM